MTRARRTLAALVFVALVFGTAGYTYARAYTYPRWHVHVRPVCMGAEDSAAHLRLRVYDRDTLTARYGCYHSGY
jgi:hypothetical protein